MSFKLSNSSRKKLDGVNPLLVEIVELALQESKVDFAVVEGFRTAEYQNELFKKGVTELDGYNKKSAHQLGLAVDLIPCIKGKGCKYFDLKDEAYAWIELGRAMLRSSRLLQDKLKTNGFSHLEWGLSYNIGSGYDAPHFELKEL